MHPRKTDVLEPGPEVVHQRAQTRLGAHGGIGCGNIEAFQQKTGCPAGANGISAHD